MLSLHFNLSNPWSNRYKSIATCHGRIPLTYKCWEVEVNKTNNIVGLAIRTTVRQAHAGIFLAVSLLGFEAVFDFYDHRHWNYEKNCWEEYNG